MKLTDDVKQRKQKHFKQYRTAKQKLTNKENLVRFLHRGKPRFRAKTTRDSAQGNIQCMKCIGNPVVRMDGRTDGHVTIMSLPKFLGLIGYQISLAMELR